MIALDHNLLDLPRDFRQRQQMKFVTAPAQANIALHGLPPLSCTAFGTGFVTGIFDVNQCVDCRGGYAAPLVLLCTVVVVASALLVWYFRKVVRMPDVELKRWPSTVTIMLYHLQMVALITSMQLDWPPIFRDITRLLSLSWILRLPSISCVLNHGTQFTQGIVRTLSLAVSMLVVLNIGLFGTLWWSRHVARRARSQDADGNHRQRDEAFVDKCEFMLSIIFALQLPIMWNVAELLASNTGQAVEFIVLYYLRGGSERADWDRIIMLGITAMILCLMLLVMQPLLGWMFWRRVQAFALGVTSGKWRSARVASFYQARMLSRRRGKQTRAQDVNANAAAEDGGQEQWIAPQRLNQRVRFLVNRYAVHAPEWQLVIWLRQSFMAVLSILYNNVAHPMGFGWTGLNSLHYESFWLGGCLATMLAFFTFSWWHHWQQRGGEDGAHRGPYAFDYQNRIESRFLLSTILMLLLQVVWVTCVEAWRATVQNLMIGVLLLSVANALFELVVRRSTVDESKVLDGALARIDRPLHQALLDGDIRLLRCDWLCDESKSGKRIERMQDLPAAAFFSASEAAALFDRGDRSVFALSYSFASLPQHSKEELRNEREEKIFKRALKVMAKCYASVTGTAVIQVKDVPPGTRHYDRAASTVANDVPDGVGYSGWCSFEQGCSLMVTAHIATAGDALDEKIERAEARWPKLTDISGGQTRPVLASQPMRLLQETAAAIDGAKFYGEGDREKIKVWLAELEWDIRSIIEQATSAHRGNPVSWIVHPNNRNQGEVRSRELSASHLPTMLAKV